MKSSFHPNTNIFFCLKMKPDDDPPFRIPTTINLTYNGREYYTGDEWTNIFLSRQTQVPFKATMYGNQERSANTKTFDVEYQHRDMKASKNRYGGNDKKWEGLYDMILEEINETPLITRYR